MSYMIHSEKSQKRRNNIQVFFEDFSYSRYFAISLIFLLVFFWLSGYCVSASPDSVILKKIEYKEVEKGADIFMYVKGNYEFSAILIENPLRIVIDLKPVINKTSAKKEIKGNYVLDVRISQFSVLPYYITRVVVDLKNLNAQSMDYSLVKEPASLLLKIELKSGQMETVNLKNNAQSVENSAKEENEWKLVPDDTRKMDSPIKGSKTLLPSEKIEEYMKFAADADYIIGPEDLLDIRIFELPELSNTVRVSSTGNINFPPLGDVVVEGLSKSKAEKRLSELLQKNFINEAHVIIFIKEFKSQKVDVIGAVRKPGNYPMLGPKTILEILSEAGGLDDSAGDKLYIFRNGNLQTNKIEINLKELLKEGKAELNLVVRPGDIINIPTGKITVYIYGEVTSPGAIELKGNENATLLKAITKAGGPTDRANIRKIVVKSKDAKDQEKITKINLKDVLNGKKKDMVLEDGDVIVIPESFF